jgi:hypothetical protein
MQLMRKLSTWALVFSAAGCYWFYYLMVVAFAWARERPGRSPYDMFYFDQGNGIWAYVLLIGFFLAAARYKERASRYAFLCQSLVLAFFVVYRILHGPNAFVLEK